MSSSNDTVYYVVPTGTTNTMYTTERRGCHMDSCSFATVVLCVAFSAALIIYGVLEYKKVMSFSTEASDCHVKGVDTERVIRQKFSRVNLVWYVDIVKKPQQGKNSSVLHTNLKIMDDGGYIFGDSALQEAKSRYNVGKTYPCYIRKRLLSGDTDGSSVRDPVQWDVPSRTSAFTLLACGAIWAILGIIVLVLAIVCGR